MIDPCPAFNPSPYQHWKRELKLRTAGFPTATVSHMLSNIITVLPHPSNITGLSYMGANEGSPGTRTFQALIKQMDERYAKTDSG